MGTNQSIYDKKINLKGKGLKNVDASEIKRYDMMKDLKAPRALFLSNNKLTLLNSAVCTGFAALRNIHENLREVYLENNKLQEIPEEFLLLVNLSLLKLDHNELQEIPYNFARSLYNLKELYLNHNKLKKLPWNFNKLRQLRTITLNHNELTFIPNTFGELQLDELSLHQNPINEEELFASGTIEGALEAILNQKIPKEYREEVRQLMDSWISEGKGLCDSERQFLFFLQEPDYRQHFYSYLEKEYSHENLDFWQIVDLFKQRYDSIYEVRSPELLKEAMEIYTMFIAEGSPRSINIPSQISDTLRKCFSDAFTFPNGINQWTFDGAYNSIFKLMYSDTFSRYRVTEEGASNFGLAVKMWETRIRRFGGSQK